MELGACNLAEINGVLFDRYHSRCQLKGLRLIQEFQIAPKESIILSDINKIKSIFFHLLNNAIKFSEKGCIRYGFRLEGDQLLGYVSDEGPGIEEKDLKLLTQHFTQVEDHLTRQRDGLGIGLSISKAFAESLNGTILIESTPGKGSTFSLSIPYRHYEELKAPEPALAGKTLADKEALEVIIVDDDLINLQLMRKMLEKHAIKIHEAQNGVEAIKLYEQFPNSDLILMDLKMPLMDGYEAVEEIRNKGGLIPIIAQTAYAMPIDKEKALDSGCNDYISKPLNKDLLLAKIDKLAQ